VERDVELVRRAQRGEGADAPASARSLPREAGRLPAKNQLSTESQVARAAWCTHA
jgi:hypothetical protein